MITTTMTRTQFIGTELSRLFYEEMVPPPDEREIGTREHFHRLLFGMISNRMTRWEDAMALPHLLCQRLGYDDILECLLDHDADEIAEEIARPRALHRYPRRIAESLCASARQIAKEWDEDIQTMWADEPLGETLVTRLKSLHGVGDKIGNLTARVLLLNYKNVSCWGGISSLKPSPDRHVMRVFHRLGLIASVTDVSGLFTASEALRPTASVECDGAWALGLTTCHASSPECSSCVLLRACDFAHQSA